MIKKLIVGLALYCAATAVYAQAALLDFNASMSSFSAEFTQTVYDSESVPLQESSGSVELLRPGRFRWTYVEPNSQLIVADGITLWVFDEDIKQVTVQPQESALGSAPIGLLSGQKTLESEFTVTELGVENGLQWFELEPKVQDTDFNTVYIALDDNGLHAMELRDNFDQATQIKFSNFKKNVALTQDRFVFTPPEDADVVGEMGTAPVESEVPQSVLQPQTQQPEIQPVTQPEAEPQAPADNNQVSQENRTPVTIIDGSELQIQEVRE